MSKKAKVLGGLIVGFIVLFIVTMMMVEKVPAGYVGVVYSMSNGVEDTVLTQGWHVISPWKKVSTYSVATEQLNMAKKGDKVGDSFNVICSDGTLNVDLEMSYSFNADDVTKLYTRYRGMTGETVIDTIIKGKIKTYVSEITSNYTVLEAHMTKKAEFNKNITEYLKEKLIEFGVTVESANLTRTAVDPTVEESITQRSKVSQELEIEKQKQEKAKLVSETAVITAEGAAKKKLIEAQNAAEVLKINSEAQAVANNKLATSITPELIAMKEVEARLKHGWVTVQGADTVVTTAK